MELTKSYRGAPRYKMPAKRFDLFIKQTEIWSAERMAENRVAIDRMGRMELPYNVVKEALESAELQNDVKLDLNPTNVSARIVLLGDDRWEKFEKIFHDIQNSLVQRRWLCGRDYEDFVLSSHILNNTWIFSRLVEGYNDKGQTETQVDRIFLHVDVPREGIKSHRVIIERKLKTRPAYDYTEEEISVEKVFNDHI